MLRTWQSDQLELDKHPRLEELVGIKGQYWMFEHGQVWNVRSHKATACPGGGLNASQESGEMASFRTVTRGVGDVIKAVAHFRDQALQ